MLTSKVSCKANRFAVFANVEPVVTSVMDGYNVCILAYGQTGILHTVSYITLHCTSEAPYIILNIQYVIRNT